MIGKGAKNTKNAFQTALDCLGSTSKICGIEMNERINELAIQADATVLGTISGGKQYTFLEQDLAKFAQLIVAECVGVVEGGSFLHDQAPTAIFARECSHAIKEHFGC